MERVQVSRGLGLNYYFLLNEIAHETKQLWRTEIRSANLICSLLPAVSFAAQKRINMFPKVSYRLQRVKIAKKLVGNGFSPKIGKSKLLVIYIEYTITKKRNVGGNKLSF